MSKIITGDKLKDLLEQGIIVENADPKCAEGIKYDFRLGTKLLKSCFNVPIDIETDLQGAERHKAVVEPGEVVFILSRERLNLPPDIYIQLSPKRSLSQDGIELLGGLTVDSGYEGFLVFGLKNIAGKPYRLYKDTKIVGANFFELSAAEAINECDKPVSIEDFPQRLQDLIDKYEPVNPQNLAKELLSLQKAFEDSQGILTKDVGELKEQIKDFAKNLLRESVKREEETKALDNKLGKVEGKIEKLSENNIKYGERLDTANSLLKDIDARTKKMDEELIGSKAARHAASQVRTIIITAVISVVCTVIGGTILFYLNLI